MKSLVVIFLCFVLLSCTKTPPIAKDIGLPIEDEARESSMHFSKVALVYSKNEVEFDLYKFICGKASSVYGGSDFNKGAELNKNRLPESNLVAKKYAVDKKRGFKIESRDQSVSIWVIDYEEHVVIILLVLN